MLKNVVEIMLGTLAKNYGEFEYVKYYPCLGFYHRNWISDQLNSTSNYLLDGHVTITTTITAIG